MYEMENGVDESPWVDWGLEARGVGIKISSQAESHLALDLMSSAHWAKIKKTGGWLPFIL